MAWFPGGEQGLLAVTTDPINPTSIIAALAAVAGTIYAAKKSAGAQSATATAQIEANQLTREAADWQRANDTIDILQEEARVARDRAIKAEDRADTLATLHRQHEEVMQTELEALRNDNRRLRVDLAAMVAIVRDEITKEAAKDAYPDLFEITEGDADASR